MKPFRARVYGETFRLDIMDAKPEPAKAAQRRKLERVLQLLEQFIEQEYANEEEKRRNAAKRHFDKKCDEAQRAYGARNPHLKNKNCLSIPVSETDESRVVRKVHDSIHAYGRICEESQAAYAARNPHKRG